MAGVVPNPGTGNQTFVFRYQYLLIEVGTEVMQKLFDDQIGTDFGTYLTSTNLTPSMTAANKLQWLIDKGKITNAQQAFLPPRDNSPMSSNFDITLLSCLLRNVCGLCHFNDEVWTNPRHRDHSREADVTRLRQCRNDVAHMRSVSILDTDLANKWTDLTKILKRLNSCHGNGVTDLTSKIDQAEHMVIDDNLRKQYDTLFDQWKEMKRLNDHKLGELQQGQTDIKHDQSKIKQGQSELKQGQSEIKQGQSEIKHGQSEIKQGQFEIKDDQSEIKQGQSEIKQGQSEIKQDQSEIKQGELALQHGQSQLLKDEQKDPEYQEMRDAQQAAKLKSEEDLKNRLIKMYQEDCCSLPVLPLCDDDEVKMDLLSVYQPPTMFHVPYHKDRTKERDRTTEKEQYPISSYKEIFSKGDHCFSNIFITGDAGVGKPSLCKCMALLWYKSKCNEKVDDEVTQKNIEFMGKFDFTFFVFLRDTDRKDVITMIIEQVYTETECEGKMNELYELVQNTLKEHVCLVILDGLDEWSPKTSRKKHCALPDKITAEKCCFLITCRPYRIETVRLTPKDLDRQVQIRGISGESKTRYVKEIVARCNKANDENRSPNDFVREVKMCGLDDQLCVPIVGSQLVAIWFDCKLTDMSRALIYSNILEMLFERAEKRCKNRHKKRRIHSPSALLCSGKLPNSLTDLVYFKTHFDLLAKICFLSFRSLFKFDKCASVLVYSRKQLMTDPYSFSDKEMDSLCKIGILSRNKVIGQLGKQEQKLSFLHKSYLEYFAALFVSSFDNSDAIYDVVKDWTTLNDIMGFQNFFIFLSGISCEKVSNLFQKIYSGISTYLTICRRNALFPVSYSVSKEQLKSLQRMIITCFKQVSRSSNPNFSLKLEDFIFHADLLRSLTGDDESYAEVSSCVDSLKHLLLLNSTCVHSLHSVPGEYFVEFDKIRKLQMLQVGNRMSTVRAYDVQFNECMVQNKSTLHTVRLMGKTLLSLPELPLRSLKYLTSLSLLGVSMQHNDLDNLVKLLSEKDRFEYIDLSSIVCEDHWLDDSDCTFTLNLQQHKKLTLISLRNVDILCNNVNISSLKAMMLAVCYKRIVSCYTDLFNCIKYSKLEQLNVSFASSFDYNTEKTLTCTVKTLSYIKSLKLTGMELPDDVLLQLHPEVTQVKVELYEVTMSPRCFHCFIESFVNNKSVIKVEFQFCKIKSVDGETHRKLSVEESVDNLSEYLTSISKESVNYMSEYLTSIATVNITRKNECTLEFETRSCQ